MPYEAAAPAESATPALIAALKAPSTAKAALLVLLRIEGGAILVTLPDGRALQFGDGAAFELRINDYRFARRIVTHGDIGFAEGWIAGEWETPDLPGLLELLAANTERITRMFEGSLLGKAANWVRHLRNDNTRGGSRRNILAHYDLGNRFYECWLDRSMTYSAARFDMKATDLEAAQIEKYRALAEHLALKSGEHVLEIGCGWGGFAEFAAREYGVRVTGVTISDAQHEHATARMARSGLGDRVEILRQDYRDITGAYDKVASIEMFEAVGEKYWGAYFGKIASVLKPGGRAALQVITIRESLFEKYRRRADFIQRYIFPGGMLPSMERLRDQVADAGLVWRKSEAFGGCYTDTLAEWARRFEARWDEIRALGFDERFKRLWLFYLGYCEAGFRTGRTDVVQVALAKPG
ncbi:class I SAM-dependent methyltransferase [Terricaulis sp.]|uniref:class I SAM-dependent methyltransferase n=1 Tax=Terricaulis sp. TaxID=2768686 RepID=UPI00378421AA